jgi:hypothetical protein
LTEERALATIKFGKLGHSMISECLPRSRKVSLAYNLGELKDLPMMYRKTVELYHLQLKNLDLRKAGDQYLNWKFGWEQTLRGVQDVGTPYYYRETRKLLNLAKGITNDLQGHKEGH